MEKMLKFCNLPRNVWEEDQKAWRNPLYGGNGQSNAESSNTNVKSPSEKS